jgi:HD-GYP domain-containing protein (c-di-GMP phosphodiesterase class II)
MPQKKDAPAISHADALDILVRFQTAAKIVKYYDPSNANVQEHLRALASGIEKVLAEAGEVEIQIRQKAVFVNRLRIKFDVATYGVSQALVEGFRLWGLQTIGFTRGIKAGDLEAIVILIANADPRREDPYGDLFRVVQEKGLAHVRLEPLTQSGEEDEDAKAAKMFFLGIAHVKEIFEEKSEVVNFNVTKRWIQSMFNHIAEDESFVYGLTNIKNFDEYTLNHSVNVCVLSVALGRRLGLSRRELTELGLAAFLHDFGKVDIPPEILNKPGKLDPEEMAVMEGHSHLGAERLIQLMSERGIPHQAVQVAMEHHITPDLGGYPKYHKKRRVALFSKIVKITDFFDALTTKRVYRPKAFSREETIAMMLKKSGEDFDPILLKVFASMIGTYPVGSLVVLDTGEIGIVYEENPQPIFGKRPKVKIITDRTGALGDGGIVDLADIDPQTRKFARTIVKSLDADKYKVKVSDFFLAQVS